MAEKKIVKINGTTWEITPVTYEEKYEAMMGDEVSISDYALEKAKYVGKCLDNGKEYWLSYFYKKDIKEIMDCASWNKD